jgi:hypothetical protein
VLGGGVAGAAGVDLEAGDGAEVDDVGVGGGAQQGQEGAGDPEQPDDVGVEGDLPVGVAAVGDRVETRSVTSRDRVAAPIPLDAPVTTAIRSPGMGGSSQRRDG